MNPIISRQIILVSIALGFVTFILLKPVQSSVMTHQTPEGINIAQQINFEKHFQELGINGSILIEDLNTDQIYQHNPQLDTPTHKCSGILELITALSTEI